jgi:hypothetical protein
MSVRSEEFYPGQPRQTQAQYEAVMSKNPSRFQGAPDNPVESSLVRGSGVLQQAEPWEGLCPTT